jgi:hypothetical protein
VALTSEVSVVVIDCTDTGAPPPTSTEPTLIWRLARRGASAGGGVAGMPRLTVTGDPYLKMVIGLTISAVTVSSVSPPNNRITM